MTGRRATPISVVLARRLMATHGWDGYAAAMAWADVSVRGPESPWWPEVTAAVVALWREQYEEAFRAARELFVTMTPRMQTASRAIAQLGELIRAGHAPRTPSVVRRAR